MRLPRLLRRAPLVLVVAAAILAGPSVTATARFDEQGALMRPKAYREWVYVGTPLTPNELNDGEAAFPGFHNVYIDPQSFARYRQTGRFPDGTMIVREFVGISSREGPSGKGYFMGEYTGLQVKLKDAGRFSYEPGNWGYFSFGRRSPVSQTAEVRRTGECAACHLAAADEDTVFTQYYPVLRAARPEPGKRG